MNNIIRRIEDAFSEDCPNCGSDGVQWSGLGVEGTNHQPEWVAHCEPCKTVLRTFLWRFTVGKANVSQVSRWWKIPVLKCPKDKAVLHSYWKYNDSELLPPVVTFYCLQCGISTAASDFMVRITLTDYHCKAEDESSSDERYESQRVYRCHECSKILYSEDSCCEHCGCHYMHGIL